MTTFLKLYTCKKSLLCILISTVQGHLLNNTCLCTVRLCCVANSCSSLSLCFRSTNCLSLRIIPCGCTAPGRGNTDPKEMVIPDSARCEISALTHSLFLAGLKSGRIRKRSSILNWKFISGRRQLFMIIQKYLFNARVRT